MDNITTSLLTETDINTGIRLAADNELNYHLLAAAKVTLETGLPLHLTLPINITDCRIGSELAVAIIDRYGERGLPAGLVSITFHGNAGQGFGAGNTAGMELTLVGKAGDYAGQGMSGGQLVVRPSLKSQMEKSNGLIVGKFVAEGSTGGKLFLAGPAGDYFGAGNAGAAAVVEGLGNNGCRSMMDGVVVIIGRVGHHLAANMQGGLVFVLDEPATLCPDVDTQALARVRITRKDEAELLKHLLSRHVRLTGSIRGQDILEKWPSRLKQFWKIFPQR